MSNLLPSQRAAILGVVDPDLNTAGAVATAYVDLGEVDSAMAVIMAGTLGGSGTLDAKLEQATDSSGTGKKDITGKAITQLTQAGTDSDKQAIINVRAAELDVEGGFTHVRCEMTVAVASCDSAVLLLGFDERHGPADVNDLASVDEIVV